MSKGQDKDIVLALVRSGLKPAMETFFKSKNIAVRTAENYTTADAIKFILIENHEEDWDSLREMYQTVEKGISIISLTEVREMKRFLVAGGKAVISDHYFSDRLGQIFVKRLFSGEVSLHMDEVFGGNFLKYKSVKITNHNRSGHYTDLIAADAFEQEYNNVAVRGFLYNSIYYLSYLHQSGLSEVPFDIEYAQNNKYFVVQAVATVKNFFLEYMINSFGETNNVNPIAYILKENFHLAHAMDVSYMEKANAIIITGIWEKKAEGDNTFASFSFNHIKQAKQIILELEHKIEHAMLSDIPAAVEQTLDVKPLPGGKIEATEAEVSFGTSNTSVAITADAISDDFVSKILEKGQKLDESTTISGVTDDLTEGLTRVAGSADTGNDVTIVKGNKEDLAEEAILVKGRVEDMAKGLFAKISGDGLSPEDQKIIVKQHVSELMNEEILRIKGTPDEQDKLNQITQIIADKTGVDKGELHKVVLQGSKQAEKPPTVVKGDSSTYTEAILIDKLKRKEDEVKQLTSRLDYFKGQVAALEAAGKKALVVSSQKMSTPDNLRDEISKRKEYQVNEEETQALLRQMKTVKEAEAVRKLAEREKELVEIAKNNELDLKKKEMEFHGKEVTFTRELEKLERGIKGKELILTKTKESVKLLVEKKDNEIRSLTERLNAATLKINTTAPDPRIDQFKKENSDLTFEVSDLKKKLIAANNAAAKAIDVKDFNEEMNRLKSEHQRTINEKQVLTTQTNAMKKETLILKDKIKEMESMIAEARKEPYNMGLNNKNANSEDSAKMRLDLQRVTNEKANLQTNLDKVSHEVNALRLEVSDLRKRSREAEVKTAVQQNISSQPPAGASQDKAAVADMERANAEFSKMIKERDSKLLAQTEKLQELENKLQALMKENENLSKLGQEATKGKVAQLDAANKKLTADLVKAQAMVSDSKKEMAKIKSESTGLKNQVDRLTVELEKATKSKKAA